MAISLSDILTPQISRVAKSIDNLVVTIYGMGGLGKTPVATKMPKPYYFAFGKSGLSGLNNVPFASIQSWSDFKQYNKLFCNKKNYEVLHEKYNTIILDEMEILYKYCEEYVAGIEGVRKIKEGNNGYGLWGDLKDEWEREILRIIGSGFCIVFILHAAPDDTGRMMPVGDMKRMLPILMNHSEIIGYVMGNGINPENGKPIHSSLMLAGTEKYFARTRNEYFDPYIEDFTADNLIQAYYTALDRQEKTEGVKPISAAEKDKMYETEAIDFEELMRKVSEAGNALIEKCGRDTLTDIVENVLGKGGKVGACTPKQAQAVQVILGDINDALMAD